MRLYNTTVGALLVSTIGLSAQSTEVPFTNIESWLQQQNGRSAVTALEKAAAVHAIDRLDFQEGSVQRALGRANSSRAAEILRNVDFSRGTAIDSVIKKDEIHYFYYKTDDAASVRTTLAWLDAEATDLDIRIRKNGGFVRPWSQASDGTLTRKQDETGSTVERVDTEIKKAEEFVISVTLKDKNKDAVPYAVLVSGGTFSEHQLRLQGNLQRSKTRAEEKLARVAEYVSQTGAAVDTTLEDGTFRSITDIVDGKPVYYQTFNLTAAKSSSTQKLWPGGELGLDLTGSTLPRSIGIWDGGTVLTSHTEFEGRVTKGDNGEVGNHGTHVAGTMVAAGKNAQAKGMASDATMVSYKWDSDEYEMNREAQNGLAISQHSYGQPGNVGYSRAWDDIANDNPFYVISKSAGNDSNYKTVSLNGNAKNILTIGSAVDQPNGWVGPNIAKSSFSSEGPAPDYRIKPEILANGSGLYSCNSSGGYENMSGTSMAGPAHAGSVALLHELWYKTHGNTIMRSATMRALVCNTADEMGSEGPSYSTGFGYLNTATAAQLISNNNGGDTEIIQENSLSNGETVVLKAKHIGSDDIAITIAWNDPASSISGSGSSPRLVNDLDLRVVIDGTEYLPWAMNTSTSKCFKGDNTLDNIEKVQIDGSAGRNVEIKISHKGSLSGGSQNYSVVMSGVEGNTDPYVTVTSPNGGEEYEQNSTEVINWRSNVDEPVNIVLFKGGTAVDTIAKSAVNSGSFAWNIPLDLETGDDYTVSVECITTDSLKDKSDENFEVVPEYIITEFPWVEPFEEYTAGETAVGKWTQEESNDEMDWLVFSGVTPTGKFAVDQGNDPGTGPLGDHTSGDGNYIYIEATDNWEDNKSGAITSPKLDLSAVAAPKLSYWLQMNSQNNKMGSIDLNIVVDGEEHKKVKTYSGHKGLEWFSDSLDLTPYKGKRVQLEFHATVGDSFYSDICIDDITIEALKLPSFGELKNFNAKEGVEVDEEFGIVNGVSGMSIAVSSDQEWLKAELKGTDAFTLSGTPAEGDASEETVVLTLTADGQDVVDSLTITIKKNGKPSFTSDNSKEIFDNEDLDFSITLEDSDSENDLTISATDVPAWVTFSDLGDGSATLTGAPGKADTGSFMITLKGSDGVIATDVEQEFTLTVKPSVGILDDVTLIEKDIIALPNMLDGTVAEAVVAMSRDNLAEVTLYIFDHLGNLISEQDNQPLANTPHDGLSQCGVWSGYNSYGQKVAPGIYSAVVKAVSNSDETTWYRTFIAVKK